MVAATMLAFAFAYPASAIAAIHRDRTPLPADLTDSTVQESSSGGGGGYGRLFLGLAIVIAVVYAIYWGLKRANRSKQPAAVGGLNVVATMPLAQNRAVHLVSVGDELVLIGSAENGVVPLRVFDAREAAALRHDLALRESGSGGGSGTGWKDTFDDLRRKTAR